MIWAFPNELERREKNPTAYIAEREVNWLGGIYFVFFSLPITIIYVVATNGALSALPSAIALITTSFNIFKLFQERTNE